MPGLLDFLFGAKPLKQAAQQGSPAVTTQPNPTPAYSPDTMRAMAEEAARRAQQQEAAEKKAAAAQQQKK